MNTSAAQFSEMTGGGTCSYGALDVGLKNAVFTIVRDGLTVTEIITFDVQAEDNPVIHVSTTDFTFDAWIGYDGVPLDVDDMIFILSNTGGGAVTWTDGGTDDRGWLDCTPSTAAGGVEAPSLLAGETETINCAIDLTDPSITGNGTYTNEVVYSDTVETDLTPRSVTFNMTVLTEVDPSPGGIDLKNLAPYSNRIPSWSAPYVKAGVTDGIPDTTDGSKWPICTHADCQLSGSPTPAEINTAIDRAALGCGGTEGCIVEVPAGSTDFGFGSGNPYVDMHSNVLLRGAGAEGSSITTFRGNGPHREDEKSGLVHFNGTQTWTGRAVSDSTFPAGKTEFTIAGDLSALTTDHVITIYMNTINYDWILDGNPRDLAGRYPHFSGKVESVVGAVVTFDRPLRRDVTPNSPSSVTATAWLPVFNAGMEDIHLTRQVNGTTYMSAPYWNASVGMVQFTSAFNCWLRNNHIEWGNCSQAAMQPPTMNISLVGNRIGKTEYYDLIGDAQKSYPVDPQQDSLVANNIFEHNNIDVMLSRYDDSGIVISHNYMKSAHIARWVFSHGVFFHGTSTHNNLVEANYTAENHIQIGDNYWGHQGPNNTAYRNRAYFLSEENTASNRKTSSHTNWIANIGWRFFQSLGGCCSANNDIDAYSTDGLFLYNLATENPAGGQGAGFIMIEPGPTADCGTGQGECGTGDAPHGLNIEGDNRGANWATVELPPSLFYTSEQDWEARTGATWCSQACDFNDVFNGIGAFGDTDPSNNGSFQGSCELPSQIRDRGGPCT